MDSNHFTRGWCEASHLFDSQIPGGSIRLDARAAAKFCGQYTVPLGRTIRTAFTLQNYRALRQLGFSDRYIEACKQLRGNRYLRNFGQWFHGEGTYSHSLLISPYKIQLAEYAWHYLAELRRHAGTAHPNAIRYYCNDLDYVTNSRSRGYRRPFDIGTIMQSPRRHLAAMGNRDNMHLLPKPNQSCLTVLSTPLKFDASMVLETINHAISREISATHRGRQPSVINANWQQIKPDYLSHVAANLSRFTRAMDSVYYDLENAANGPPTLEQLLARLQSHICAEMMRAKGYDAQSVDGISGLIGLDLPAFKKDWQHSIASHGLHVLGQLGRYWVPPLFFNDQATPQPLEIGHVTSNTSRQFINLSLDGSIHRQHENGAESPTTVAELLTSENPIYTNLALEMPARLLMPVVSKAQLYFHIGSEYGARARLLDEFAIAKDSPAARWLASQQIGGDRKYGTIPALRPDNHGHRSPLSLFILYCLLDAGGLNRFLASGKTEFTSMSDILSYSAWFASPHMTSQAG